MDTRPEEHSERFWSLLAGVWDQGYAAVTGAYYGEATNPYREAARPLSPWDVAQPDLPPTGPRTGMTFAELEDAWFDANEHAEPNLDLDGRPIVPLLAQVERPPAQNPHTVKVSQVREKGKDPCWKWVCACGDKGIANTSIEADYWGKKHATASERIEELNEKMPAGGSDD